MVPFTKQAADFITLSRAVLVPLFVWFGFAFGVDALPAVIWLMIYNWTADSLDGPLSRRSEVEIRSWIGDHDLEIDMLISTSLGVYLVASGLLSWQVSAIYFVIWMVCFLWAGLNHSMGVLYQAPIYIWFLYIAFREEPLVSLSMILWMFVAMIVTWPKFPKVIIPQFFGGFKQLFARDDAP
jgi:hypothetical protein